MAEIIKKEENKSLVKKYTPEETKEIIIDHCVLPGIDINHTLRILADEVMPKFCGDVKEEQEEAQKRILDEAMNIMRAFETETQVGIMEAVNKQYQSLAKELSRQIIKDYNCKTSIEKTLANNIAHSYIKILDGSRRLNNDLGKPGQEINENRTKYLTMLSKQTDRAQRQFLAALMTLKQIKAPLVEMNIKATNAFVAQNQQINADKKINEAK